MNPRPEITVVLPCFNELENIEPLAAKLREALGSLGRTYEILYVDDASTDGTPDKIAELSPRMSEIRTVRHSQNLGQSAAVLTGFEHARGEIIITMDADLQNDPADIQTMLELLEDADAVCGVRQKRQDTFVKRLSSRVANRVRDAILKDGIRDAGCGFRVIRRSALKQLPAFRALHRFLPTILKIHGYTVVEVPVNHCPRQFGVSKYGIGNRLFVGIFDLIGIRWYRSRFLPPDRTE